MHSVSFHFGPLALIVLAGIAFCVIGWVLKHEKARAALRLLLVAAGVVALLAGLLLVPFWLWHRGGVVEREPPWRTPAMTPGHAALQDTQDFAMPSGMVHTHEAARLAFLPMILVALVVLGALATIIWLLAHQRGRAVLKALLVAAGVVGLLAGLLLVPLYFSRRAAEVEQVRRAEIADEMARRARDLRSGRARDLHSEASAEGTIAPPPTAGLPRPAATPAESVPGEAADDSAASQKTAPEPPAPKESVETATELSTSEAADRPEWVEAAPHKVDGAYRVAIKVGPYKTRIECDRELPDKLREAVDEYVTTYLGRRAYGRLFFPRGSIDRMLVKEEWEEPTQVLITPKEKPPEYVPMVTLHVLLEFDREVNALIQQQWDRMIVEERLVGVGGLAAVVLLLLSGVYGYLKIDLATKGKYRGWLRIAAAALILLLIVAGLAMAVDFDIVQDPF